MDRFRQLQIFIQVMESGNFTRAADALAIPRSTVSTEIQALEDRLRTQLLMRTTRKVVATQDGLRFLETARDIVDAVHASEAMFNQSNAPLGGRLRVDVPSRIGRKILLPALSTFTDQHPDLLIELSASDRYVDLVADGVDCALRLGELADSNLICRKMGDVGFVTCASPAYLHRYGTPQSAEQLQTHRCVNYAHRWPAQPPSLDFLLNGELRVVEVSCSLTVDGAEAYIAAALAGQGLIQVPRFDVLDLLENGRLVEVLPESCAPALPLSFLFVKRRNLSPTVRVFYTWLENLLRENRVL